MPFMSMFPIFSLPVYYGVTFNRLTLNGGFQISYALSCSDENKAYHMKNGVKKELVITQSPNFNVRNFDFGPRAGVIYRLTNKLSIEGMFYYGIHNINQIKSSDEELKIQQMTLGIRYALWNKGNSK